MISRDEVLREFGALQPAVLGRALKGVVLEANMTDDDHGQFEYDVALSFAGEDREVAEKFANLLIAKKIKVFYDEYNAADLWGKNLVDHLADIYGKSARYCVMFISQYYPLKKWTRLERMHAQERAFRDPNEYILPVRLDDTEVPGITETTGYRDLRQHSVESIVNTLEQKLAKSKGRTVESSLPENTQPSQQQSEYSLVDSIPMPKRKKSFTQLQKDRFAKESFDFIRKYFKQALQQLETRDSEIQTDFTEINNLEFMCKIYVNEVAKCQCRIWLGDTLTPNTIYYNEGGHRSGHDSFNDYLPVEDNGEELRLHIGSFAVGMVHIEEPLATQQQAAEYLWKRLTTYL